MKNLWILGIGAALLLSNPSHGVMVNGWTFDQLDSSGYGVDSVVGNLNVTTNTGNTYGISLVTTGQKFGAGAVQSIDGCWLKPAGTVDYSTDQGTYLLWVKFNAAPNAWDGVLLTHIKSSLKSEAMSIQINGSASNYSAFVNNIPGSGTIDLSNAIISDGNWHLLALTFDRAANAVNFYVDGVLAGSKGYYTGASETISSTGSFAVASRGSYATACDLTVDDMAFFDTALTADEVSYYYTHALTGRACPEAVINAWTFDQLDSSGYGVDSVVGNLNVTTNTGNTYGISLVTTGQKFGAGAVQSIDGCWLKPAGTVDYSTDQGTYLLWVKFNAAPNAWDGVLLTHIKSSLKSEAMSIQINGSASNYSAFVNNIPGSGAINLSNAIISDGNWHLLALTFDRAANAANFYVDGVLAGSKGYYTGASETISSTGSFAVASRNSYSTACDLTVDDMAFFDRALTADQIGYYYVHPVAVVAAAPVFSPGGKYISGPRQVTITSSTDGAAIYYTTDGSPPTTGSTRYSGPVLVNNATCLQAIAVAEGCFDSPVTRLTYIVPASYDYARPANIPAGWSTVDGDLSDWADAAWTPLDQQYDGTPTDIDQASYAARWLENTVYVAIKVRDTAHRFSDTYSVWNAQDAVEIYLHTDNDGPLNYPRYECAQQYVVGIKNSDPTQVWAAISGNAVSYPLPGSSLGGLGAAAARVQGDWLHYEVAITPFTYLGFFATGDLSTSLGSTLKAGDVIGLDVCVVGNDNGTYTGMKSENLLTGKARNWDRFGLHKLLAGNPSPTPTPVPPTPTPAPLPGDANRDNTVSFADFAILQNHYGQSVTGDTWSQGDFNGDGQVTFEDFALLQNHYGRAAGVSSQAPAAGGIAAASCGVPGLALVMLLGLGALSLRGRN